MPKTKKIHFHGFTSASLQGCTLAIKVCSVRSISGEGGWSTLHKIGAFFLGCILEIVSEHTRVPPRTMGNQFIVNTITFLKNVLLVVDSSDMSYCCSVGLSPKYQPLNCKGK